MSNIIKLNKDYGLKFLTPPRSLLPSFLTFFPPKTTKPLFCWSMDTPKRNPLFSSYGRGIILRCPNAKGQERGANPYYIQCEDYSSHYIIRIHPPFLYFCTEESLCKVQERGRIRISIQGLDTIILILSPIRRTRKGGFFWGYPQTSKRGVSSFGGKEGKEGRKE